MKRNLFQNVTAIPYKSGEAIDRTGFLSAVIGANVASGATMTVKVEHSDDGETFVPVTDERVFPEKQTTGGEYTFKNEPIEAAVAEGDVPAGGLVNIDVDLVGLKTFVKFTVTGNDETANGLVVVLGDAVVQPV